MTRNQLSILSLLIVTFILTSIALSYYVDDTYIKQHSFKQPYLLVDSGIAFWEMDGYTLVTENAVELIPYQRNMKGSIWNSWQFPYDDFDIETSFSFRSNSGKVDSGIGFWFTKETIPCDQYYGAQLKWEGVGIIFEPNRRYSKFYLVKNDGEDYMTPVNMLSRAISQCKANINSLNTVIHLKISYSNNVLSLTFQEEGKQAFKCFDTYIDIPKPLYFGITAASGNTPIQYDVYSFLTNSYRNEIYRDNNNYQSKEEQVYNYNKEETIENEGEKINEDILDQIEKLFDDNTKQVKNIKRERYTKKDLKELSEKINLIEDKLNEYIHQVELKERKIQEILKEIVSEKEKEKDSYHSMVYNVKRELEESKNSINDGLASKLSKVEKDIDQIKLMLSISTRTTEKIKKYSEDLNNVIDKIVSIENKTVSGIIYFVVFEIGFILTIVFWRHLINALKDKLY